MPFTKGHIPYNKKPKKITVDEPAIETEVSEKTQENPTRPPNRKPMFSRVRLKYPLVIVKDGVRYRTRVFNDKDDRIQRAQEAGYTVVLKSNMIGRDDRCGAASQVGEPVAQPVGRGMTGVLMMIPEEWYLEDRATRDEWLNKKENEMKKPITSAGYGEVVIEEEQ